MMDTPVFYNPHRAETLFIERMRQLRAADAVLAEAQARLRAIFAGEELASYPCEARACGWTDTTGSGAEIVELLGNLRPDLSERGIQIVSDAGRAQADAEREAA